MAGFRDFQTGEVLTAANVNDFLAKQAVMKFADATARDTALGTAVGGGNALREGMVAYLDDTDDLLKYDGSAWDTVGGGLVAVKSVVKTDTFSQSLTVGSDAAVTGLSISHAVADASHTVLLFAIVNGSQISSQFDAALSVDGTLINIGAAAGNRTQVGASNGTINYDGRDMSSVSLLAEYSPASTSSLTYAVNVINRSDSTRSYHVNRGVNDTDNSQHGRAASVLVLMEVKV